MINLTVVYNLVQYLRDNLPGETIFSNEKTEIGNQVPERYSVVRYTGGREVEVLEDTTVQIKSYDSYNVAAAKFAFDIYELLQGDSKRNGRFGLILPATTVDGVLYPEVTVARITAIQRPESLGVDSNGSSEYTQNFQLFI